MPQPNESDEKICNLFCALWTEFPDPSFSARGLVVFAATIGRFLPADKRLALARVMLDQAVELGALRH